MQNLHADLVRILIPEDSIQSRVRELAAQICAEYEPGTSLYLIGILKGAFMFLADLARCISLPHTVDFIALSSYGKSVRSGEVRLVMDLRESIEGKHVIIIEDIVDSGQTLNYLYKMLQSRGPASLRTCTFVRKERQGVLAPIDFLGFNIPDVWVVGYGLDYADKHRTLPFIAELKPEVYEQ